MLSNSSLNKNGLYNELASLQFHICPIEPFFLKPLTAYQSLFSEQVYCTELKDSIKTIFRNHRVNLDNVNFRNLDLSYILYFENSPNTNFKETNFFGSKLNYMNLSNLNFKNSNFKKINIKESNLNGSIFNDSNFDESNIKSCSLIESSFHNVTFKNTLFFNIDFSKSEFKDTDFTNSLLLGVDFTNTNISYEDLAKTKLLYRIKGLKEEVLEKLKKNHPNFSNEFVKLNKQQIKRLEKEAGVN